MRRWCLSRWKAKVWPAVWRSTFSPTPGPAVWSSCLLYWLGDRTPGAAATREFIHRRIDNVMAFEEFKARVRRNPLAAKLLDAPSRVLDRIRGADHTRRPDLPGRLRRD